MIAHKIIENLDKKTKSPMRFYGMYDEKYTQNSFISIGYLRKAVKFNLGDVEDLPSKHALITLNDGEGYIYDDYRNLHLPYQTCFLELMMHSKRALGSDGVLYDIPEKIHPVGILIEEEEKDSLWVVAYQQLDQTSQDDWMLLPAAIHFKIGEDWSVTGQKIILNLLADAKTNRAHKIIFNRAFVGTMFNLVFDYVVAFLRLMSCKNISTELIKAPEKLNKKRLRNGKLPIFDYYVLNIDPLSKSKHAYHNPSIPLSHNRVHLCRGHFKTYTKEHPLLGRGIGTYWWQPHARGQNKEGMIVKDYKILKG